MSNSGGPANPQSWRRSPDPQVLDSPTPAPGPAEDSLCNSTSREKVVRIVMGSLSVVDWVRGQWLLWLFCLSIGAAYYHPVPVALGSNILVKILVFVSFTLIGASFPDTDRNSIARFASSAVVTGILSLIISPLVGAGIYLAVRTGSAEADYLFVGFMCTMCLPPSAILSVAATRSAQGNEALAQCLSAIGSISGVIASPLLMIFCVSLSHTTKLPDTASVILFPSTVLAPFLLGIIAQRSFSWASHRRITGDDRETSGHVGRIGNAQLACSELCDGSLIYWRQRAVRLNCLVMLLLNYLMFSSFFIQATTAALLTWHGVGLVLLLELGTYTATCIIGWLLSTTITEMPEERIALFFVLITKSEVLAIPILLYLYGERRQAAVILLPSLLYHLIQAFATAVLSFPIRRWRYRYNCRPGTTLLPLRLSKATRATSTGKSLAY